MSEMVTISGKRMLGFVAPIYENSSWIKSYFDALGVDFDTLTKYFGELRAQAHINSGTWGIEYLERKYSVEPAPQLSLDERRARLRIKAANHLPLNPAVLEKFARENFGFECYLDELTPGYIRIIANNFPSTANKFVPWLIEEKPAHLALGGKIVSTWYIGDGNVAEPYEKSRVELEPVYPSSDDDKRHFPRLFVDTINLITGRVDVSIARPNTDYQNQTFAGVANLIYGDRLISVAKPNSTFASQNFVGQILKRVGKIRINSDTGAHGDDAFWRSWTSTVFAGMANLIHGRKVWSLSRPKNQVTEIHAGIAESKSGNVTIGYNAKRDYGGKIGVHVGQILSKVGKIQIDSATEAHGGNRFWRTWTSRTCAGIVDFKSGNVTIGDSTRQNRTSKTVVHVGQVLIRRGYITIQPDDSDRDVIPPDGDWLGLRFRFPDASKRIVTLANPRQDLQKQDIRDVGNHAAKNSIVLNSRGLSTTGIDLAMLTTRTVRKIF